MTRDPLGERRETGLYRACGNAHVQFVDPVGLDKMSATLSMPRFCGGRCSLDLYSYLVKDKADPRRVNFGVTVRDHRACCNSVHFVQTIQRDIFNWMTREWESESKRIDDGSAWWDGQWEMNTPFYPGQSVVNALGGGSTHSMFDSPGIGHDPLGFFPAFRFRFETCILCSQVIPCKPAKRVHCILGCIRWEMSEHSDGPGLAYNISEKLYFPTSQLVDLFHAKARNYGLNYTLSDTCESLSGARDSIPATGP